MADPFDATATLRALREISDEIKREVGHLIEPAAETMAAHLRQRYPRGVKEHPGRKHLRDDVRIRSRSSSEAVIPARQVLAPRLATIWQDGTPVRHDATRHNANRGRMPAADPQFFERTAVTVRAAMLQRAQAILDKPRTF